MATAKNKETVTDTTAKVLSPESRVNSFTELTHIAGEGDLTMGDILKLLYQLQQTDSAIDRIHLLRGELPMEVEDFEKDIQDLKDRVARIQAEIKAMEKDILGAKAEAENARTLVKKYEAQQNNVKNNREYDSLSKEIEYQGLVAELADKKTREFTATLKEKKELLENTKGILADRSLDLEHKKEELSGIVSETSKEEETLAAQARAIRAQIDTRTLAAYDKVRSNAHNGLAVVTVKRCACGGCFNKIPAQRQIDIKMSKKVIVCEYCGRILVDNEFEQQ